MRRVWSDPVVLALSLSQLVISAGLYYLFPALVLFWQDEFGWSLPEIMGAFSSALIIQGLTAKGIGRLLDRGLGPWLMAAGGAIAAFGLVALNFVETLAGFYLVWALLGLTMGLTLYDAVFALIIRSRGALAASPIAVVTLVAGLASSVAFVIAAVVANEFGWRVAVWVMAGAILTIHVPLVLKATLLLSHNEVDIRRPSERPMPASALPGFGTLTIAITLSALGLGMVISYVVPLLTWTGLEAQVALTAAAVIGVAQIVGRLLVVLVGSEWDRRILVAACLIGLAVALLALTLAPRWSALVVVFACLQGACYGISSALRPMLIRDVVGQNLFASAQGAVLAPAFIAFGLAPLLAATVVSGAGHMALIVLCICMQVISAGILLDGALTREFQREN